ncbi:tyrosine-type recombinase/integrase [Actinobacillus genomosp. 2]|uniref:phage integrase n=1 Tax=Actinobacillus genomosp. 2 TaxID=230709 RepID=UPI002441789B|nr:tyrosine-type recombinase/integrase [Actinobacillus genomosp. 2]WGE32529.1 tyrosine-type recombinase/integrase [Actinobacillus genomosp. 2]
MGVRKDEKKGKWLAEAYNNGKRLRKWFDSKAEANRFYNAIKQENSPLFQAITIKKEQPQRLSELADMWFNLYGNTLITGKYRYQKLQWIAKTLGDPFARDFNAEHFAEFRAKRLNGEIVNDTNKIIPKKSVVNFEQTLVQAMFEELIRLNKWKGDNPLKNVRMLKISESEIYFLRADEIQRLLTACDASGSQHLGMIVRICLATGARWSEAQNLTGSQVIPYKITFNATKNGKNRTVPISQSLYDLIPISSGRLFTRVYRSYLSAFNLALEKAEIYLPDGQATHVLRHTFASHFMMNGGNILVLKDILGHASIKMTMKYAHFAPSHLEQAVSLNPLENAAKEWR